VPSFQDLIAQSRLSFQISIAAYSDRISKSSAWAAADASSTVLTAFAPLHQHHLATDDYLAKPFYMAELLARIRALIHRSSGRADPVLVSGAIRFDTRDGSVTRDGVLVILTTFEQRLLQFLMHRAGQVVGRTEIIEHIYAQDFDRDSNTVEVFVRRLRQKLGALSIETIRGQGYRMSRD
jgi:DNA-binding response OmpR family regulator